MTAKWNVALSLAAGLLGDMISHWAFPVAVRAQVSGKPAPKIQLVEPGPAVPVKAQRPNPPAVIEARSFALIDGNGYVAGTFSVDGGAISLKDAYGRETWRSPEVARIVPLVSR